MTAFSKHALSYNPLIHAAKLIESVVDRKLKADAALVAWPYALNRNCSILSESWTCLRHYADDEDLHEIDLAYFSAEQERLKKCVDKLYKEAERLESSGPTPNT